MKKKQNLRILLVEDEAMNTMYLKMLLAKAGFQIKKIVATGEDAISAVSVERPDVVLMDVRLAGDMDGIETALKIKDIDDVPIIFITGYPDKEHMERAKEVNPEGYFVKPIATQELLTVLANVVKN